MGKLELPYEGVIRNVSGGRFVWEGVNRNLSNARYVQDGVVRNVWTATPPYTPPSLSSVSTSRGAGYSGDDIAYDTYEELGTMYIGYSGFQEAYSKGYRYINATVRWRIKDTWGGQLSGCRTNFKVAVYIGDYDNYELAYRTYSLTVSGTGTGGWRTGTLYSITIPDPSTASSSPYRIKVRAAGYQEGQYQAYNMIECDSGVMDFEMSVSAEFSKNIQQYT